MLELTAGQIAHLVRKQPASLWGQPYEIEPCFVERVFGDGEKLVAITPLNTRPAYYLIRVDSRWSDRGTDDENCMVEHIDEILEAIEEEVGPAWDEEAEEKREWPALDDENGCSWCYSNDLIGGPSCERDFRKQLGLEE